MRRIRVTKERAYFEEKKRGRASGIKKQKADAEKSRKQSIVSTLAPCGKRELKPQPQG
jgi:hypothetical protein